MKLPYVVNPHTGRKSFSHTASLASFLVVLLKFLLAGLTIKGYKIPDFTSSDFALSITAITALYNTGKFVDKKKDENGAPPV